MPSPNTPCVPLRLYADRYLPLWSTNTLCELTQISLLLPVFALSDIKYSINKDDRLGNFCDLWDDFAGDNGGQSVLASKVLNHSIWEFIVNPTIREVYRRIFKTVRTGRVLKFNFRCDSPHHKRFMEMILVAGHDRSIDFTTKTLSIEKRATPIFLDPTKNYRFELVTLCSWCSRIKVNSKWQDLDIAVRNLRLLEEDILPNITHAMCEDCFSNIQSTIDQPDPGHNGR